MYPVFVLKLSSGERIMVDNELVVGRDVTCNLFLNDQRVSRQHARIWLQDDILHMVDLKSSNGTRLNGEFINYEALVYQGDTIQIGKTSISVDQITKETNLDDLQPELTPKYSVDVNPTVVRTSLLSRNRHVIFALMRLFIVLFMIYAVFRFGVF